MSFQNIFDTIYDNNFELFKELSDEKIVLEARSSNGFNLLHAAVAVNRTDILDYLLSTYSCPVNERCIEGRTPFFYACEAETPDFTILKKLIQYGSDINMPNKEHVSPLHNSCRNGNTALVKLLIGNGVQVRINENNGYTVLHYIALSNCVQSFYLLKNYDNYNIDFEINKQDFDGISALMLAVDVCNIEIAKEFINTGADCNIIGRETTALHLAVIIQDLEIFELLWKNTNFEIITKLKTKNNLVKLLIKYGWFFPDRIEVFFKVLDHPKILDLLTEEIKILTVLFYRIRFVKNLQEINTIAIIKKFLQIGINITQNDLRVFILNFYRFNNRFDILNVLIQNGNANIDDKIIIKFVIELYPNLVPKLLPFCAQTGPVQIINYFTEILRINKDMIKLIILMLYFSTPDFNLKQNLIEHLSNFCYAIINFGDVDEELLILYQYIITCLKSLRVSSLKELSRDVFRNFLAKKCNNSKEYLNIINNLQFSKDIINLIQCTFPVNVLQDL